MTAKSELIYILINFAQKKRDKVVEVIHYNVVLCWWIFKMLQSLENSSSKG